MGGSMGRRSVGSGPVSMVRVRDWVLAAVLVLAVAAPAWAEDENVWSRAGKGVATGLANVLYIPAKIIYAGVGGLVGGLAYCVTVGDMEVANSIWEPSVGGSYVLSTETLFPPPAGSHAYVPPPEQPVQEYEPRWPE